jgi:hypothetical protein
MLKLIAGNMLHGLRKNGNVKICDKHNNIIHGNFPEYGMKNSGALSLAVKDYKP